MEVSGRKTCEQGSKGYIENVCKPCEDDCKNTAADGWCRQCEEYMCSTCFRHHRKGKFCKDHELLDHRNSGSVPQKASASDKGLEKCRQHFKKLIKFYCPTHGQVGCGDCMVLEHKACNVVYIPDKAIIFKDSKEFENVLKDIESCSNQIEECLSSIQTNRKVTETVYEQFIEDAEAFRDEIVNHVNKLTSDICNQVADIKSNNDDSLSMLEKEALVIRHEISSTKEMLESQRNQPNKLFVTSIQLQQKLRSIKKKMDATEDQNKAEAYNFKRSEQIESAMVKCNLIGLIQRSTSCDEVDAGKREHSSLIPEKAIKQETVNVSKAQSLLDRKLRTDNIHVDGDHLSFTHDNALQDDNGVYIRDVKMTNGSYFEVKIIRSGGNDSSVGIGLVPKDYPEQYFPGWGKSSVGYHTDDGCVFIENTSGGELLGQPCRKNDTIGCGITSKTLLGVNVFFAINGRKVGEKFLRTRRSLYPAVALDTSGQKVKVSFDALVPSFQTTE
ncbi:uncharacterized protein LOC123542696 [Mercenaria mercenaria]|uniref:uncharacterized protein LOC123542696 n=1 Tax=Mercenaria mercenaria TaxID=6596 RepID=UPI00234FB037|nr:uncharacterized protein LOC123542696 [Mercenaria mercenaria]